MGEHPHAAIVRQGYEAFSKGDVDTLSKLIASDAVHHVGGDNISAGEYKGLETILGYYGNIGEWTDGTFKVEPQHYFAKDGKVSVVHRITAQRQGRSFDGLGCLAFTIAGNTIVDLDEANEDEAAVDEFWGK